MSRTKTLLVLTASLYLTRIFSQGRESYLTNKIGKDPYINSINLIETNTTKQARQTSETIKYVVTFLGISTLLSHLKDKKNKLNNNSCF